MQAALVGPVTLPAAVISQSINRLLHHERSASLINLFVGWVWLVWVLLLLHTAPNQTVELLARPRPKDSIPPRRPKPLLDPLDKITRII
jgi:uncharacterized membrane protein YdcZ (DUF606 family)